MSVRDWIRRLFQRGEADPAPRRRRTEDLPRDLRRKAGSPQTQLVIGLDFGTSSTKVVFRNILSKHPEPIAVDFGTELPGFSRFAYPSGIRFADNQLTFGPAAADAKNSRGLVLTSPKLRLISDGTRSFDWIDVGLGRGPDPADFADFPPPLPLEFGITCYLAHVLVKVREIILQSHPSDAWSRALINIDVPVATLDGEAEIRARYQRLLDVARYMAVQAPTRGTITEWYECWTESLSTAAVPPLHSERKTFLIPEALAVVQGAGVAFSDSSDIYNAIVDIGAGTIDVGWFKLVHQKAEERLPFFASGTRRLGCDRIDRDLANLLATDGDDRSRLAREIGPLKAALARGEHVLIDMNGTSIKIHSERFGDVAARVGGEMYGFYSDTFGAAFKKERDTRRWNRLRTIVAGGGSLIPQVISRFSRHPRTFGSSVDLIRIGEELRVKAVGASEQMSEEMDAPFLLAAVGLSFPKPQLPRPIMPGDIDDLPPDTGPTGPYRYVCTDLD